MQQQYFNLLYKYCSVIVGYDEVVSAVSQVLRPDVLLVGLPLFRSLPKPSVPACRLPVHRNRHRHRSPLSEHDRLDQGRTGCRHDGDASPLRRTLCRPVPVPSGGNPACRQILPGQSFRNILDRLCLQRSVPPRSLRHQTLPITPSKRIITEYSGLRFRHNDVHLPLIVACCVTSC